MYTLSLLLLALFSLYIGIFAFWRWDASWLRELDAVPAKLLFVLVFALFLCAWFVAPLGIAYLWYVSRSRA